MGSCRNRIAVEPIIIESRIACARKTLTRLQENIAEYSKLEQIIESSPSRFSRSYRAVLREQTLAMIEMCMIYTRTFRFLENAVRSYQQADTIIANSFLRHHAD